MLFRGYSAQSGFRPFDSVLRARFPIPFCCVLLIAMLLAKPMATARAQQSLSGEIPDSIRQHLNAGEFPAALELTDQLKTENRDRVLSEIARRQLGAGAPDAAFHTAFQIQLAQPRSATLQELYGQQFGGVGQPRNPQQPNPTTGQAGGVTLADFTPLINLIQNTIDPDGWEGNGQGLGTLQPYPSGVFVSADGTLKRIKSTAANEARKLKQRVKQDNGNRNPTMSSELRTISLPRLEKAAQWRAAQGLAPDPMMENLAGLYEIKFIAVLPDSGDVVIAGPAGEWEMGPAGRPVNTKTGKPVLQLDDLVVCLRNTRNAGGQFGCSINPREENLVATREYLDEHPAVKGKRWAAGLRDALGKQDIEVFGIEPDTHAARVLVEADYRMKLIGMGLEPSIPQVPSYLDRIAEHPDRQSTDVIRWWFTMNYDDIVADPDRMFFQLVGPGVKVQSENEFLNEQGQRVHTGQANPDAAGFAKDFTQHFEQLADRYPVYRQLKNVFDMALVAALIRKHRLDQQVDWQPEFFAPVRNRSLQYLLRRDDVAKHVESVMNEKVIRERKETSTVTRSIIGVSGGVSFNAATLIDTPLKVDSSEQPDQLQQQAMPLGDVETWWWD